MTNQQVTGSGGQVYTFDGTKWVATAGAGGVSSWNTRTGAVTMSSGDVTTALTFTPYNATNPSGYQTAAQVTTALAPYAPLAAPVFTGDARAVTPAYGDNDTSVSTTAFVQSAVAPAMNGVGRNLVTNGTFVVQQRGMGPFTASGVYTADRWLLGMAGSDTDSVSIINLTDADRAAIGDEAALYALQDVFTGSAVANSLSGLAHRIESVRRLGGKTVTFSFWAKATSGTPRLGVGYYQSFGSGGSPSAGLFGGLGITAALTSTWTRYAITGTVPSTSGKTLGTTASTDFTQFEFALSDQANTYGTGVGVQSGTVQLYGVQLEIGTQATVLDAGGTPQAVLAECQRFYQTGAWGLRGYAAAGGYIAMQYTFPVQMRATPSTTLATTGSANVASRTIAGTSIDMLQVRVQTSAAADTWDGGTFTASADL